MNSRLTVLIPFLNEEKTIRKVVKTVLKQRLVSNIILIDDGSTDSSVQQIKPFLSKKVSLIKHKKNLGKGAAIISGIKKAIDGLIIIQDADLEYYPSNYSDLIAPILKKQVDFVLGNRWSSKRRGYLLAQAGNAYLVKLTNLLFGKNWNDTYTGYKIGPKRVWRSLKLKSYGFEIEAEITGKLALKGFKVMEIPINYNPRKYTEGKKINWLDVIKGTLVLFRLRFGKF